MGHKFPISDPTNTAGHRPRLAATLADPLHQRIFPETQKEPTLAEGLVGADYGLSLSNFAHSTQPHSPMIK